MIRRAMAAFAAGVALAVACAPALATRWVRVGGDAEGEHFVDDAALSRTGEIVRLVKRVVYLAPHPMGDTPGMPLIRETLGVVECDCLRAQHRAVSVEVIGMDGHVLITTGPMKRIWERIEPDSPGRATLDFACARTAP
ncbi:MAG: hypothetical protein GC151_18175 [Betaproteobacteria bacterium]|nr:hypothetical protein [Betaproteobacteria bacterium]